MTAKDRKRLDKKTKVELITIIVDQEKKAREVHTYEERGCSSPDITGHLIGW